MLYLNITGTEQFLNVNTILFLVHAINTHYIIILINRLFQSIWYVCCVQLEILYFRNRQWVINLASGSEYERGNVGIEQCAITNSSIVSFLIPNYDNKIIDV